MDAVQFLQFMDMQRKILEKISNNTSTTVSPNGQINVGSNVALVPNFEALDTSKESFDMYKQRFENYTRMKNVFADKEYCSKLLLNSIGAKMFNTVTALAAPKNLNDLKYNELIELLKTHLAPRRNVLVSQHKFLSSYQMDNQSIADYIANLKSTICDCEFYCHCRKSVADVFLRAQFRRGLNDNNIREQLLQAEVADFSDIVTKAIAIEAAKMDS